MNCNELFLHNKIGTYHVICDFHEPSNNDYTIMSRNYIILFDVGFIHVINGNYDVIAFGDFGNEYKLEYYLNQSNDFKTDLKEALFKFKMKEIENGTK